MATTLLNTVMLDEFYQFLGEETTTHIFTTFCTQRVASLTYLEQLLAYQQWALLRQEIHSLKGGSANVGAAVLSQACRTLEQLLDQQPCDSIALAAQLAEIAALFEASCQQFADYPSTSRSHEL